MTRGLDFSPRTRFPALPCSGLCFLSLIVGAHVGASSLRLWKKKTLGRGGEGRATALLGANQDTQAMTAHALAKEPTSVATTKWPPSGEPFFPLRLALKRRPVVDWWARRVSLRPNDLTSKLVVGEGESHRKVTSLHPFTDHIFMYTAKRDFFGPAGRRQTQLSLWWSASARAPSQSAQSHPCIMEARNPGLRLA